MTERVFNLFMFIVDGVVKELGVVCHKRTGSDREKLAYLQARVDEDVSFAKRYPVPSRYKVIYSSGAVIAGALSLKEFQHLLCVGDQLEVFEEVFNHVAAQDDPLFCLTPVIDGKPQYDITKLISEPG